MKKFTAWLIGICSSCLALGLGGCSDANVDLQRQITVLKDELEKSKAEKAAAPDPPANEMPAKSAAADAETLRQNYESAGRTLRAALEKKLTEVHLESFTLYQPKLEPQPHKSEFSMEFRASGVKFTLDHIPVRGSMDGTWFFPSVDAVVAQVERVRAVALAERQSSPNAAPAPRSSARPAQAEAREVSSPATANRTVAVEWDSKGTASPAPSGQEPLQQKAAPVRAVGQQDLQRTPRQQDQPQPSAPASAPSSVMPAQREVQIKF